MDLNDFSIWLRDNLNICMKFLAFIETVIFIITLVLLIISLIRIKRLTGRIKLRKSIVHKGTEIEIKNLEEFSMKWDDYSGFQSFYSRTDVFYTAFSLIIQLFPLIGILGTVAGLYISLSNGQINNDNIYSGVGFALSSTIYGIVFAIIFKLVDILISAVLITPIDSSMDMFEKDYQISSAISLKNGEKSE